MTNIFPELLYFEIPPPPEELSVDSNDSPPGFEHSWKIEHFEHLFAKAVIGQKFYSEVFFSPGGNISDPPFPWRLSVTPKPSLAVHTIDTYLEAVQSPAESNVQFRRRRFQIKVFCLDSKREGNEKRENLTLLDSMLKRYQNFKFGQGVGKIDICRHDDIWPDKDKTARVDLVIKVIIDQPVEEERSCDNLEYFANERFADITFTFSTGERIPAHRLILASGSECFKDKLRNEWTRSTIAVTDIDYATFRALIYYLYSNRIEPGLSKEALEVLYSEARTRSMTGLSAAVVEAIFTDASLDNWHEYYRTAWIHNDTLFQRLVLKYALDNWDGAVTDATIKKILDWGGTKPIEKLIMAKDIGVYATEHFYA